MSKLFVDMDGVLADFDRHLYETFGYWPGDKHDKFMWKDILGSKSFFRYIPPFYNAKRFIDLIEYLDRGKPYILTACPHSDYPDIAKQKIEWIKEHIGDYHVLPVIGGRNKGLFLDRPRDILIDDMEKNTLAWQEYGGRGILHKDYNTTFEQLKTMWE